MQKGVAMRFFRPAVAGILVAALAGLAPATSFDRIRYCGGTVNSRAGADEWDNTLAVAPEQIVLYLADGQRVKIDPARVTGLSYGQEAERQLTTLVDLGVIVAPVPLLGLIFKTRQHFIGIEYRTEGGDKAGLLIQAHKDNYRAVLQALRGATHAPISVADEDRQSIASAIGDEDGETAPAETPEESPSATPATPATPAPAASSEKAAAPADSTAPPPAPPVTPAEKGTVRLATTPTGADIYVDESFVGQTPARLRLVPGKHRLRLSLAGGKDWDHEIEVLEGSEVTLQIDLTK
jgi:hypothetical protein